MSDNEIPLDGLFAKFMMSTRETGMLRELRKVSKGALLVWLCLATHINNQNECWPAQKTIYKESGVPIPTIKRAISELEATGLVKVWVHGGPGGRVNKYWVSPVFFQFGDTEWTIPT